MFLWAGPIINLHVHLYGRPAMVLEADPHQPPSLSAQGSMSLVSARWSGGEDVVDEQNWLSGCLPENGSLAAFVGRAQDLLVSRGRGGAPRLPETILWANANAEYPGAVSLSREGEPVAGLGRLSEYTHLGDHDFTAVLADVVRVASGGHEPTLNVGHRPRISLSGQRPKTGISLRQDGVWCQGKPGQRNTWIVKVEESQSLPGEAGIESICQRAAKFAGLSAARTMSRVCGGYQCVLSERSDRLVDKSGTVRPVHQEDFRQASGWGGSKYASGLPNEPTWPAAYSILLNHSEKAQEECDNLTRLLAISWLLRNADLHRSNLGFLHDPEQRVSIVTLAPAYDISSSIGTNYQQDLAFGVGGQRRTHEIGAQQWRAHARKCRVDVDRTLNVVQEVVAAMPDAFNLARSAASQEDENKLQRQVDDRCEKMQKHIKARADHFNRTLARVSGDFKG